MSNLKPSAKISTLFQPSTQVNLTYPDVSSSAWYTINIELLKLSKIVSGRLRARIVTTQQWRGRNGGFQG